MKLHLENHPRRSVSTINELEMELWERLADAGVLFGPGMFFVQTHVSRNGQLTIHAVIREYVRGHCRRSGA